VNRWRGAALERALETLDIRAIARLTGKRDSRRLPRITQRVKSTLSAQVRKIMAERRIDKTYRGWFPGAACCRLTELQWYKTAPLQHLQPATRVQFGLGAVLQHLANPTPLVEHEDDFDASGEVLGGRCRSVSEKM
jgi:hypothetical protein